VEGDVYAQRPHVTSLRQTAIVIKSQPANPSEASLLKSDAASLPLFVMESSSPSLFSFVVVWGRILLYLLFFLLLLFEVGGLGREHSSARSVLAGSTSGSTSGSTLE